MYDVIIIGAGPAGMTAAIYTARKQLSTLLIAKEAGGQMSWSADIENYSGFTLIRGPELTQKFLDHTKNYPDSIDMQIGEEVTALEKNITSFQITTKSGKFFYGRSIIIASGKSPRSLGVPGEDEFFGHGVAVCATCDAPLYKGKDVAVVGGGNSAMDAALALAKIGKAVHIINVNTELTGDVIMKTKLEQDSRVFIHNNAKTLEITGDKVVTGVKVQVLGKTEEIISVQGVFVEIGYTANTGFDELTQKNQNGEIIVDRNLQSTVPGIYCAGDVNDAWGEQIIIAAGEGAKAAMAVSNFLNTK